MSKNYYLGRILFSISIFLFLFLTPVSAQVYFSAQGGIITQFEHQGISPYTEITIGGGFGESIIDWSIYGSYWQKDNLSEITDRGTSAGGRLALHLAGFNSQFSFFTGLSQQFIEINQQNMQVGAFETGFTADFRLTQIIWLRLNVKQNLLIGSTQFVSDNRWNQRSIAGGLAFNF